jgi:hypothetical protein
LWAQRRRVVGPQLERSSAAASRGLGRKQFDPGAQHFAQVSRHHSHSKFRVQIQLFFRALAWLDTLDLRENLIRSLGPCIFCGMNVSRALLGRNLLGLSARPVHREAFAETRIRELDLGYNHFRHFDSEMLAGAQPWVEVLHLSGNSLSLDSPGLIRTLPRLRELHMAECGLASSSGVPYSLPKQFQQLTLLNLSGNGLDHLPPNLGSLLPQLQVLDISHNRFRSIHPFSLSLFFNTNPVQQPPTPVVAICGQSPAALPPPLPMGLRMRGPAPPIANAPAAGPARAASL